MQISKALLVTPLYIALLGLIFIPFTLRVGFYRINNKIYLGDGDDPEMLRRIRGQANFVETVPLAVVLLLVMELLGAGPIWLHALACIFHQRPDGWAKLGESELTKARRGIAQVLSLLRFSPWRKKWQDQGRPRVVAMVQAVSSIVAAQIRPGAGKRKASPQARPLNPRNALIGGWHSTCGSVAGEIGRLGASLVLGRLMHYMGLARLGPGIGRPIGMSATLIVYLVSSVWILVKLM